MSSPRAFKIMVLLLLCLSQAHAASAKLPLMIDNESVGLVTVNETAGGKTAQSTEVANALEKILSPEAWHDLRQQAPQSRWQMGQTFAGITLNYNSSQLALVTDIPPSLRRPTKLALRNSTEAPLGRVIKPDKLSAYVNMYAAENYMEGFGTSDGRQPLRLDFDGAVNLHNWVLESQAGFVEKQRHSWLLQNTRLVRDDPDKMIRYQVGQLSYPTAMFQRYQQLVGVGWGRNFSLQPYLMTQPAGRTGFVLGTPSTVDVYINGIRQKQLQLQPGVYELSDFPVVNGANDVRLVITDANGRVEEKAFPIVNDGNLLEPGLSQFSGNLGIPDDIRDRQHIYDSESPMASGLFRYGLTSNWTTGANLQGTLERQLAGLDNAWGSPWGMFRLETALSRGSNDNRVAIWGGGARLEYRNLYRQATGQHNTWQVALQYQGHHFNPVSTTMSNPYGLEAQASYGHTFTPRLSLNVGSNYRFGRSGQPDDYRASANMYYAFLPRWGFTLNNTYSRQSGYGVFLNLSWSAANGAHMVNGSYDSDSDTWRTDWARNPTAIGPGWDTNLHVDKHHQQYTLGGDANYRGERGNLRFQHDRRMSLDNRIQPSGTSSQLSAATALVYSGGAVALSRPVAGGFAIVTAAAKGKNAAVALNPTETTQGIVNEAESGWLGPAVISELTPYAYRNVNADIEQNNTLMRDAFVLFPSYKSGVRVVTGKKDRAIVQGYLQNAEGKPLGLIAGALARRNNTPLDTIEPAAGVQEVHQSLLVFTNREGRFRLDDLAPGLYTITFNNDPTHTLDFDVPEDTEDINLGTSQLNIIPPGRVIGSMSVTSPTMVAGGAL